MIGTAHDFPCIAVIMDVTAPSQRLIPDLYAVRLGDFTQFRKIIRRTINPADRGRMHRGTNQNAICAQLRHRVELGLRAVKGPLAQIASQAFEIAKRLEQCNLKPMITDHLADFTRGAFVGDEILFKDFDAVKASLGNGMQFFPKVSGNRDGRD